MTPPPLTRKFRVFWAVFSSFWVRFFDFMDPNSILWPKIGTISRILELSGETEPRFARNASCGVVSWPPSKGVWLTAQRITLGPAHHKADVPAAALPTHEPPGPIRHGRLGTVSLGHLGGIGRGFVPSILAPNNELQMRLSGASEGCWRPRLGSHGSIPARSW